MPASSTRPMREAAFSTKPRARVMVYRDWLCDLAPVVNTYVQELCHKRRAEMTPQMIALYELAQETGNADFVAALELAAEQQMYGAEYVRAIVSLPTASAPASSAETSVLALLPQQVFHSPEGIGPGRNPCTDECRRQQTH